MYHATLRLIPRLSPQSYDEPDTHDEDVARLRKSAWHLVGTTSQLASLTETITLVYQLEPVSAEPCEMNVIELGRVSRRRDLPRRMWA